MLFLIRMVHKTVRIFFRIGKLITYDSLIPSMSPPYYGREVTLFAQMTTGVLLFIFSLIKLVFSKVHQIDFLGGGIVGDSDHYEKKGHLLYKVTSVI